MLALVQQSLAQNNNSAPAAFGCASSNGATNTYNVPFIIGQAIYSNYVATAQCHNGFPYDAQYLQNTFVGGLWSSKGYYSDYVLLKWSIGNNANSITSFVISRRLLSDTTANFQIVATLDPSAMTWQDPYCETGVLYQYKVYATGITNVLTLNLNYVTAIGFRQPVGTATGRITYAGGTAVPNVSVLAQTNPTIPTSALVFNGVTSRLINDETKNGSLTSGSAFTFQAWINDATTSTTGMRTIFNKTSTTLLQLDESSKIISFTYSGLGTVSLSYESMFGNYFHITAMREGKTLMLQLNNGTEILKVKQLFTGTTPNDIATIFHIGEQDNGTNRFAGLMDEIRIWSTALDSATIQRDYDRVLTGTEPGLGAYYQCNEAVGNDVYDETHTGNTYNGNNASLLNVGWTNQTPLNLNIKGVTDANGNYQISGIPFIAGGSTYTFTPMMGVHSFNPSQALRYFAAGSNVSNNVDFTDKSSFKVSGIVYYKNTSIPVKGVSVLIDGSIAIKNIKQVVTDENGSFNIDVPIGLHRITLAKQGHVFVDGYPTKGYKNANGDLDSLIDFQKDIVSPISFYDATLSTLTGRVTGGVVEQAKPLGFGLSKNNLGYGKLSLTLQTSVAGLLRDTKDSIATSGNAKINSSYTIYKNNITIYPDTATGEYAVQLPPESYLFTNAVVGKLDNVDDYTFDKQDLGSPFSIDINIKDSSTYRYLDTIKIGNKNTYKKDSVLYRFNKRFDFTWRNIPTIQVLQKNQALYGDSIIVFSNDNGNPLDTLQLHNNKDKSYTLSYPIFHQSAPYSFIIKVFETYTNKVTLHTDTIPQSNSDSIYIANNLSKIKAIEGDTLNNLGTMSYTFVGGDPNLTSPYTSSFSVLCKYKLGTSYKTVKNTDIVGIILGGASSGGSNFITAGPTKLDMILRDPPGTNSSVSLEKGSTITSTESVAGAIIRNAEVTATAHMGVDQKIGVGLGVMTITDASSTFDASVGLKSSISNTIEGVTSNVTTNTELWSTSSNPTYVGSMGDIFIGHSTNIVFGKTNNVYIKKDTINGKDTSYIATATSFSKSPQFGTAFIYSQNHIKNYLIPNLISIRNSFFAQEPLVYIPKDKSNPMYVNSVVKNDTVGDAYTFCPKIQMKKYNALQASDSILVYNSWINEWKQTLANNEEVKVKSIEQASGSNYNHSFDAGASYQSTVTNNTSHSITDKFHAEVFITGGIKTGFEISGVGIDLDLKSELGLSIDASTGIEKQNSITYNYTLADENQGNYLSVDVIPAIDHFGPVFRTRGGQTMCPYEGEEKTKYFEPNLHVLNVATEPLEKPHILVNGNKSATQINVPANSQAYFTLNLQNLSQAGNTVLYDIAIVGASNPNGAVIKIDGQTLGNGLSYTIPSLNAINKTLSVAMGLPNIFKYEKIGVVMRSNCQGDPTSDLAVIADTVFIDVEFTPACTPITLIEPLDKWTMNVENATVLAKASNFNKNELNFESITLEWKPASSSSWAILKTYYKDSILYKADTKNDKDKKALIEGGSVLYTMDGKIGVDQNYDVRAVTHCIDKVQSLSNIASGLKDMKPPHVFGTPQPSTGILNLGQDISLQFDEAVEAGLISKSYVQVSGTLNGSSIAHDASLNFDGASGYAKADGFCFTEQPFTVEFWMKRTDNNAVGTIFSRGITENEKLEIGTIANGKMQVTIGKTIFTIDTFPCFTTKCPADAWHHYALTYDTNGTSIFYGDDKILSSKYFVKYSPRERSSIYLGRSANGNSFGKANVGEVRIWNTARTLSDIYGNMSTYLSGSQQGLVAYWPLNEGTGSLATDRAASHSLSINTSWEIALENKAMNFDASKQQALLLNTRQLTLSNEHDATIEFWFKAGIQSSRACLLYNGVIDSTATGYNPKAFGLFLEPTGVLTVTSGGITNVATLTNVSDNEWHHFALVIDRLSNVRTYLDGAIQSQLPTTLFTSIVGLDMSIGARRAQITTDSVSTIQYFTGLIDEVRIWETARKESLINRYKNTKLQGNEIGLRYYLPFEAYWNMSGTQVIQESLKNNVDSTLQIAEKAARTDTVIVKLVNGASYSLQAPAVKDAQPCSVVPVTFDVNNDKMIINLPKQYASLYEHCILDMSIKNVSDKNANSVTSPIQWSAFINQNPVVWSENSKSLSMLAGQGESFTVDVVNNGGLAKNYVINGLPVWLTASPQMGIIQPNSSITITFTVNNGLNVGSYSQIINLTTDYGYDEKLQVDVTVKAQAPNWTVDASKYQYSMNVFGKLQIDGIIATNENDLVAAFVNGECRGVTSLKYLSSFDLSEAMLSIYSNKQSGDSIKLLVWDANTGIIYSNVTPTYTFTSDVVIGSPKSPVLISCDNTVQNTLTFNNGWNWISINVANPQSNSVESILGSVGSPSDEIWGQKSVYDQYSTQSGWSGSLDITGLDPQSMYKLHLTKAGVALVNGKIVDTDSAKVTIVSGWNWIGFVPQFNESVNEALASYGPQDGDLIKSQKAFSMYYKGLGWIGTLSIMEPGKGYMLQTSKASTLVYPKEGLLKSFVDEQGVVAPKILGYTGGNAKSNATILAQLDDSSIDLTGKVLALYSGSKCNGFALPMTLSTGKNLFFLVADDVTDTNKLSFALVDTLTNEKTAFTNQLTYSSNSINGSINNPYLLKSETLSTSTDVITAFDEGSVYPNPFHNTLHVSGNLNEESIVHIRIIDVLGKEVFNHQTMKAKGAYSIDLNNQSSTSIDKLTPGWYTIEVNTNSGTFHSSILKQ